jgi:hypothetical protein
MSEYSITHAQRIDDYAVIQTLEVTEIGTGQVVTVTGVPGFNGTFVIQAVPTYLYLGVNEEGDWLFDPAIILPNQLLYFSEDDDVARDAVIPQGTLEWEPVCTWASDQDVLDWLGIDPATPNDEAFVTTATNAANAFAYRRRRESGYFDSLTTVPGPDVLLGTIMLGGAYYRERGSTDSFQSFDQMGGAVPFGSHGQINKLLGVNRAQVA